MVCRDDENTDVSIVLGLPDENVDVDFLSDDLAVNYEWFG